MGRWGWRVSIIVSRVVLPSKYINNLDPSRSVPTTSRISPYVSEPINYFLKFRSFSSPRYVEELDAKNLHFNGNRKCPPIPTTKDGDLRPKCEMVASDNPSLKSTQGSITTHAGCDSSIQRFKQKQPRSGDEMASKQKNHSKFFNPNQSQLQEKVKSIASKNQFPKNSAKSNTETQKTVLGKLKATSNEELQALKPNPLSLIFSNDRPVSSIQCFKWKQPHSGEEMATKEKNPCKILHPNQNQLQEKLKSNGSKNQFPKGSAKSNAETPKTVYGKQKMRSNEESQDSKPNPPTSRSSGSRSGSSTQSIKQKQPHTGDKMASKQKIPCKIVNSVQCQVQEQLKGNGSKNQFPKNSAKSNTETPNTVLGKQKMRSNEELQDSKSNHLSPMSSGSRSGSLIQSLKQKQPRSGDEMASKQKNLCKILNPHQSQVEEKLNGSMNHFPENSAKSNTVTPKTVLGKQKMRSNEELQNSKPNLLTPISSGSSLVSFSKLKSDCSKNQFPKNSAKSDTEKPKTVFGKQKVRLNEELQASKPYPLTPISFDSRSDYSIQSFNQKQPQSGDEMASKQKNPSKIINPHQSQLQEKLKNNCSKNQFPKNSATSNTETQKTVLAKQKVSSTEELQASKLKPLTPISSDYRSGLSIQSFKQKKPRSGNELVSKQKKTSEILHSNKSQLKEKLKSNGSQNQFPKNSAKSDTEKPKTVLGKQKVRLIKELQASKFNPLTPISSDSRSSSSIQSFKQKQPSSGDEMASNQKTPSKILNLNQGRLQEKLKSNGPKNDFPNNSTKSNTEMPKTVLGEQKVRSNEELQASELNPLTPISSDCSLTDALAMDCEMVGICSGGKKSALGRVTLVNTWGNVVYDEYSRPMEHVVDYRTAISGIQPCDLIKAKDFYIVRKQVAKMINHKILVGHALHHDLKALLLNHPKRDIRDTSKYAPYLKEGRSCSLKKLAAQFLGVEIQNGQHCPVEDARAVMLLYQKNRKQWESSTKDVMGLEAKTKKRKQRKTFKDTARGI